ncbi:MmgE/PrpD family protein [Amycolatopsis sp. K13G38]|uniref:MmgE/PrpD family protein n=1 Tax=Amycolatopsis acididurans TaxID=2724524 RepID=A0ABX1IWB3_9PSEU|nr:MmgE/PrpD family protein [Amycolatopsis acididurans]NKQ51769.1 MmgE/PrpD family protein [Amycolatopsis acididurans]
MTAAERLVDGVRALPETVPDEIDRIARLHLLDAVGVAVVAARLGPARTLASARRADGPCTVLGTGTGAQAAEAALVNGTLVHSLEYDDTHTGSVMHGSSVLAPAVLAAAEARGCSGAGVVRSFVAGWEVLVRLGLAAPSGFQRTGFQGTSVAGPIAGAVAVGLLHGFDRDALLDAVGVAASFSAGNFTFLARGATSKAAQAGIGAQAAISAVALAGGGITGARDVFEGERGLFGLYARDPGAADRLAELSGDLGSRWYLADAAFKALPCCHFLHPFAEAIAAVDVPVEWIRRIVCRVPEGQEQIIAEPWARKQAPARADEARWSLPYVVALQAVRGAVALTDFDGEPDPAVLAMAARVDREPWPDSGYPAVFPAAIEVELTDGTSRTAHVEDVDGSARRPWDAERVTGKFRDNCLRAGIAPEQAVKFSDALISGPEPDFSQLRSLVGADG